MPAIDARTRANRLNAAKSTGPRTPEGKAVSRRNSLKHGLSGDGVLYLEEETAEVERRTTALLEQLKPKQELSRGMVERMAILAIRLKRCAEHETLYMTVKGEQAGQDFDDERIDRVSALFESLAVTPDSSFRKLCRTWDGMNRLIEGWKDLKRDLDQEIWTPAHAARAANLQGFPAHDCHALTFADGLAARTRLGQIIQGEIDGLTVFLDDFDAEEIGRERSLFVRLARFAPTPETLLTRKYEAAAERNLFRTLREARAIDNAPTLAEQVGNDSTAEPVATAEPVTTSTPMASFVPEPSPPIEEDDAPLNEAEQVELAAYLSRYNLTKSEVLEHFTKTGETASLLRRKE